MDKLNLHTSDFTDENIKRIAELFPDCVTEDKDDKGNVKKSIDFDLLRQELSKNIVEGSQERYQLNWPGKREALLTANAPIAETLRPCPKESVDFDATQNLFIEGDNLDALKLMQETYLGKIKMIYIDPPYNTGNDFIYEDDFAENTEEFLKKSNQKDEEGNRLVANTESNGRFHSDWLSMMYPRLKLARNLLKDDGVIFISIDDSEQANLKRICDEIFGEHNFLAQLVWENKEGGGSSDSRFFRIKHEYVLCYTNSVESCQLEGEYKEEDKSYSYSDEYVEERGRYKLIKLNSFSIQYSQSLDYEITLPNGEKINPSENGKKGCWRWSKKKYEWGLKNKFIEFRKNAAGKLWVYTKQYFKLDHNGKPITRSVPYRGVIDKYSSTQATKQMEKIFKNKIFDYSKPYELVQFLSSIATNTKKEDIILDFFAGSSTTAHAVMQLNAEDGGNRKFIMVQLPEPCDEKSEAFKAGYKTIAEIGKERIRRAGKEIKARKGVLPYAPTDTGFRVLKVDSSNMQDVYYSPDDYSQDLLFKITDNIKPDRSDEDLLFQVLLDWGVDLTLPIKKEFVGAYGNTPLPVFFVNKNALAACFARKGEITEDFCKELAKREPLRVVFRDLGFKDDSMKINVEQIFKLMSPHTDVKTI